MGVSVLVTKACLMALFFLQVTIFGGCVSGLACFSNKKIMDLAMTFSGTLFLSIAMIDVIPQAIAHFDQFFAQRSARFQSSSLHQGKLPLTMIIAAFTMLVIMALDKLLLGHSHDHQYQISFVAEPKRTVDGKTIEMKRRAQELAGTTENAENISSERQETHEKTGESTAINWKPFVLQLGMSIHAFFQTLALGLQKNTIGLLSLASAIAVHKWAEGLTLGLMYKKQGYGRKTAGIMVGVQGFINVLGLLVGSMLMGQGSFVMAFFMSMSAGTFFYISLGQVLQQQLKSFTLGKLVMVLLANTFIAFIVWFQKAEQAHAEAAAL